MEEGLLRRKRAAARLHRRPGELTGAAPTKTKPPHPRPVDGCTSMATCSLELSVAAKLSILALAAVNKKGYLMLDHPRPLPANARFRDVV